MPDDPTQNPQQQPQAPQGGSQGAPAPEPSPSSTEPQGDPQGGPEVDPVEQESDVAALRHEAASRRRALRATEAERDALLARVDSHDRAEVDALAAARMADPSDLWSLDGVALEHFRDSDGALVPDLVQQSITEALSRKPHWRLGAGADADTHPGARQAAETLAGPSFGQALKSGG